MLKLYFLIFIKVVSLFPQLIRAECCLTTTISFRSLERNCLDFGGFNAVRPSQWTEDNFLRLLCKIDICDDGRPVTEGAYCGNGPCNIFGCNCDNGCRKGENQLELFKDIYKSDIKWANY
ncbi:protein Diedel-like [Leptopilina heterotoma]|uniref:protein Diedel-like n=1 Tax=Leptopilina heterotoma TaxID=63436 RepID=UPI001CA7F5C3|nr:protein Diedel-like [Leptopilina heterotoma]